MNSIETSSSKKGVLVPTYFLSRHVYLCRTLDGVLVLDARNNRYIGLPQQSAYALSAVVSGWPFPEEPVNGDSADSNTSQLVQDMLQRDLLTDDVRRSARRAPLEYNAPADSIYLPTPSTQRGLVPLGAWMRFLASCARIRILLAQRPLEHLLDVIREQKVRSRPQMQIAIASELVSYYTRMRALVFTSRDHCLYDSLVLSDFLARYLLFPSLVIGVCSGPFRAHCWIQHGVCVFNDDVDRVRHFTPIVVV